MRRAETRRAFQAVLMLALPLATGCRGHRLEVFSLAPPQSVRAFDDPVYFGGELLSTTPRADHVYYLFQPGPDAPDLRLIERNLAGEKLRDVAVPQYTPGPVNNFVAVHPDGRLVAYRKDIYLRDADRFRGDLYTYDLDQRREDLVLADLGGEAPWSGGIAWADRTHLVALLANGDAARPDRIAMIDTAARQVSASFEMKNPNHFALSASGELLAVTQTERGSGIHVFRLPSLEPVTEIRNTNRRSWMNHPAWNPSASQLAFVDADDWISVLTLGEDSPRRVAKIPDDHVCYFLAFPNDDQLLYECGIASARRPDEEQISFLDLASGEVVKTIAAEQISSCIVVAGKAMMACNVCGAVEIR